MYKIFDKYILRTPLLPVKYYLDLTQKETISDDELKKEFSNPAIQEAIYLASPILYKEIEKWSKNEIKNDKEKLKIRTSFLKYLSRLSARPTPFGLFAGSSLGSFSEENSIIKQNNLDRRNTRLDMNFTGILIKHLEQDESIRNQLLFYPNSSLYIAGNQARYVEVEYNKTWIKHQLVEVNYSDYLESVLIMAQKGSTLKKLASILVSEDISTDEAEEFILELATSQILVSEMQQTVSGEQTLNKVLEILGKNDKADISRAKLVAIKDKLLSLDSQLGNSTSNYLDIINILRTLNIPFDEKYLFQTDLRLMTNKNFLNKEIKKDLFQCVSFLNKISEKNNNRDLTDFKKAFVERYESREMPLSLVLDEEVGIGYPINSKGRDINPLLDDLAFNTTSSSRPSYNWSMFHSILFNHTLDAIKNRAYSIELTEKDFDSFAVDWNDLPDTFSAIAQIISLDGEKKVVMDSAGGSSAGNLMARFCHGDTEINKFVHEISNLESAINNDKIVAEIIHLPEDRLGNILIRPAFRKYEIPYLSASSKEHQYQIPLNDMFLSIINDKIILKSKRENVEILPRLTTAHNYKQSQLPVYRFLCDIQHHDKRAGLVFDWGTLGNQFSFLPRVIYKNVILSTAKWKVDVAPLKEILNLLDNYEILERIKVWSKEMNIPQFIYLAEGDNKLLINLFNINILQVLNSEIKSKEKILFEEFLFQDEFICNNDKNEGFVNEFIFSFYKNDTTIS